MHKTKLIIENCEDKLSEWLFLEYKHASEIWNGAIFTNVKDENMKYRLESIGKVYSNSFYEICGDGKVIILDPKGKKELRSEDFLDADFVVVGGILGYEKPRGRTYKYITSKAKKFLKNYVVRNLGEIQLSIDTACLVAKLVSLGMELKDIEITREVEIFLNDVESVVLPYGYVVVNGKIIITPGLIDYLKKH